MTRKHRRINEKPGMGHVRIHNAEKGLSFCRRTQQRLIHELADGIHERYGWYDKASLDYRPTLGVFTAKARAHPHRGRLSLSGDTLHHNPRWQGQTSPAMATLPRTWARAVYADTRLFPWRSRPWRVCPVCTRLRAF